MLALVITAFCAVLLVAICARAWAASTVSCVCPFCDEPVPEHHLGACDECARYPHRRFVCGSTR